MGWLHMFASGQSAWAAAASWSVTFWVHSTLIIGAVWVIAALVRASAEARDVAWKWALCLPFVTASVHLLWPERPFAQRFTVECAVLARAAPESSRADLASASSRPTSSASVTSPRATRPMGATSAARLGSRTHGLPTRSLESTGFGMTGHEVVDRAGPRHDVAAPTSVNAAMTIAASGLALGVVFAVLVLFVLPRWRLARLLRKRTLVCEGALFEELRGLQVVAGGAARRVRLSVSDAVSAPIAFGVWRPEITVPRRALDELSAASARALLAHELAHHARRDPLWVALAQAACTLFMWQPMFRVARREWIRAAELCADDLAIEWTRDGLGMARCIAEVASWLPPSAPISGALAMVRAQDGGELRRRVERALERPTPARNSHFGQLAFWIGCGAAFAAPSLALVPNGSSDEVGARRYFARPAETQRDLASALPAGAAAALDVLARQMQVVEQDLAGLRTHAEPSIRARGAELEARAAALRAAFAAASAGAAGAPSDSTSPPSTETWSASGRSIAHPSTPIETLQR